MRDVTSQMGGMPVGLLFSSGSLTAAVEATQYRATLLAIDEVNSAGGIHGVPLLPITLDIGPEPADYEAAARQFCNDQNVRILFGTHMSNQRKAVLPVVEKRDALLFYPTLYEGFEYSRNCIYTGAAPNQNCLPLARHFLNNHGSRILLVGNNYVFARESNRIMRDLIEQGDGTVVDEIYLPLNAPVEQVEDVMRHAVGLAPDVIYSSVVGLDTVKLHEAFARTSLRSRDVPIVSVCMNEADLDLMSADAAEGHITAAPYFQSLRSERNASFIADYRQRFGEASSVTAGAEAAYFQVHLFALAARKADQVTLPAILNALGTVQFDAPQGPVNVDADTHHTYLWPRIARVDRDRNFVVVEEQSKAVRPEPFMIQHTFDQNVSQSA